MPKPVDTSSYRSAKSTLPSTRSFTKMGEKCRRKVLDMYAFDSYANRPTLFNYTYSEVISGQTYLTFYGLYATNGVDDTIQSYESGDDANSLNIDATNQVAQTFTVGSEDIYVKKVEGYFNWNASSFTVRCEIRETSSGAPVDPGLIYATQTFNGASSGWKEFEFDGYIRLAANTLYSIVFFALGSSTVYLRLDSSSPTFSDGAYAYNSGSGWTIDYNQDALIKIIGLTNHPFKLFPATGITSDVATNTIDPSPDAEGDLCYDVDFEFEVQHTFAVKGLAIVELTNAYGTENGYVIASLVHLDSEGTETVVATGRGRETEGAQCIAIDISSLYKFTRGDYLKLRINMYRGSVGDTGTVTLNHSGSDLTFSLPTKVVDVGT